MSSRGRKTNPENCSLAPLQPALLRAQRTLRMKLQRKMAERQAPSCDVTLLLPRFYLTFYHINALHFRFRDYTLWISARIRVTGVIWIFIVSKESKTAHINMSRTNFFRNNWHKNDEKAMTISFLFTLFFIFFKLFQKYWFIQWMKEDEM